MKGKPIEPGTSPIVELSEVKLVDLTQSTTERESNVPAVAVTALLAHGDPAHRRKTTIGLAAEEAYANRLSASIVKRIIGYEPRHDTEDIEHATLGTVQIDVAMVPLVQAVWDAGVDTDSCCQGEWYIENIDFGATLDSNASIGIAVGWHVPDVDCPSGSQSCSTSKTVRTQLRGSFRSQPSLMSLIWSTDTV
jgi:hypothetical protein